MTFRLFNHRLFQQNRPICDLAPSPSYGRCWVQSGHQYTSANDQFRRAPGVFPVSDLAVAPLKMAYRLQRSLTSLNASLLHTLNLYNVLNRGVLIRVCCDEAHPRT
jgi:hypothetical protein